MEHARRKNCTAYASQCHEPQRLVYHCVINEYANQILEVCAYGRIIVSGRYWEIKGEEVKLVRLIIINKYLVYIINST